MVDRGSTGLRSINIKLGHLAFSTALVLTTKWYLTTRLYFEELFSGVFEFGSSLVTLQNGCEEISP
jgi:hypothetical protein